MEGTRNMADNIIMWGWSKEEHDYLIFVNSEDCIFFEKHFLKACLFWKNYIILVIKSNTASNNFSLKIV